MERKGNKLSVKLKAIIIKPYAAAALCGLAARIIFNFGDSFAITILAIFAAAVVYVISLVLHNTFDESDFSSFPKSKKIIVFCKKYRILRSKDR